MNTEIQNYNQQFSSDDREIVEKLAKYTTKKHKVLNFSKLVMF